MFENIKENVTDWTNEQELSDYLNKILDKQAFDESGLIYGMGHAVYTLSDPRAKILKKYAKLLATEKGLLNEFNLLDSIERLSGGANGLIAKKRNVFKEICANVDLYSGFVYTMLDIPEEMFTPIFAIARISGWCSHRIEELVNASKIIRPAYKYVGHHVDYIPMEER
jgi:citrate synthase